MKDDELQQIKDAFKKIPPIISEIENARSSKVAVFICDASILMPCAYRINRIIRKLNLNDTNIDLLIESRGGDIDAASKIVKILKENCAKLSAIVPFYAKSAAALIAISSDELVMCKASELGPIDPQVRDPITGAWIPAHSIKEALAFIESVKDPLVKLSLSDRLPPLLIGAYRDAQNAAKQHIHEAIEHSKLEDDKKIVAIDTFTEKYLSHGYPIDRNKCKEVLPNIIFPDSDLENKICELHEIYEDLSMDVRRWNTLGSSEEEETIEAGQDMEEGLFIFQIGDNKCIVVNGEDITAQLKT